MGMSTQFLRRHSLFIALPVIVGLIAAGCSSDSSSDTKATETSAVAESDVSTTSTATTTTIKITTTSTAAKPNPTPGATLADPPTSSTFPQISLNPNVTLVLVPVVTSLTGKTSWTCAEALAAGSKATVAWTTKYAASVTVKAPGFKQAVTRGPNESVSFSIACGTSSAVKVTPFAGNGDSGITKTITITVSA